MTYRAGITTEELPKWAEQQARAERANLLKVSGHHRTAEDPLGQGPVSEVRQALENLKCLHNGLQEVAAQLETRLSSVLLEERATDASPTATIAAECALPREINAMGSGLWHVHSRLESILARLVL